MSIYSDNKINLAKVRSFLRCKNDLEMELNFSDIEKTVLSLAVNEVRDLFPKNYYDKIHLVRWIANHNLKNLNNIK